MPLYDFENTKTGEVFEKELTIAEREEYLKANPDLQQIFTKMNIGDAVRLGVTKPPKAIQERLKQIRDEAPGANKAVFDRHFPVSNRTEI